MRHPNKMNHGVPILGTLAKKKAKRMSAWLKARGLTIAEWKKMTRAERRDVALRVTPQ